LPGNCCINEVSPKIFLLYSFVSKLYKNPSELIYE